MQTEPYTDRIRRLRAGDADAAAELARTTERLCQKLGLAEDVLGADRGT